VAPSSLSLWLDFRALFGSVYVISVDLR
jgi:hypothetical protein